MSRHRFVRLCLILLAASGATVVIGQVRPAPAPAPATLWQEAGDAWEAGHYPTALERLRTLMRSASAAEYFDRVALLTGELHVTTVLTTDGRNPRLSGNGAYASYETGPTATARTVIVALDPKPQVVAELPATNVALDRAGRRVAWLRAASSGDAAAAEIVVRDLPAGQDRVVAGPGLRKTALAWSGDDRQVIFVGAAASDLTRTDVYITRDGADPLSLTSEAGNKTNVQIDAAGRTLVYAETMQSPFAPRGGGAGRAGGGGGGGGGRGGAPTTYGVVTLPEAATHKVAGLGLTLSADGKTIAWTSRAGDVTTLNVAAAAGGTPLVVRSGTPRLEAPALSADGTLVAYQLMTDTDWEIYISNATPPEGGAAVPARRVTRDIQHDLLPRFLTNDTLIGMMGEARHRRSQIYDLKTGTRTRLFANNTVRTISPEYAWLPSADGRRLIVQAERDGDTVSTERDISIVDLTRRISMADLEARIDRQLAAETDLRASMTRAFKPVEPLVRQVLARGTVSHVYEYEKAQFDFDSKHITQPGNAKAIEYLERTYRSFGYQPELQWFTPTIQQRQWKTANIVATLRGTENPNLIYVVSSHFDSVAVGPGADDDTSGTAALLETARMLARTPLPATVVFASFTGEEAGLLGSTEFVRLAAEKKWNIVGALNNDMIGWGGEGSRMDNTIRYSNAGIRDIQHGAAFLFTDLILYDAKYYKSTDAAAFYTGWGDIVGGIGSYPVLANPNYHQPTDFIETMNFRQILETAKVTTATIINLASRPSRLKSVTATRTAAGLEVSWTPSPEAGVKSYVVAYGPASNPLKTRLTVIGTKVVLPAAPVGTEVAVKGVNARGMDGWDWARPAR
jgi:hypothetical protein